MVALSFQKLANEDFLAKLSRQGPKLGPTFFQMTKLPLLLFFIFFEKFADEDWLLVYLQI